MNNDFALRFHEATCYSLDGANWELCLLFSSVLHIRNLPQIRLSAAQVCHELFLRSQHFRDLLIADFKDFVDRVVEVKAQAALPPPREAAKALNVFALQAIQEWYRRFGETSARLKVAYNYLRRVKGADFAKLEATAAERAAREAAERERLEKMKRERLSRAMEELRAMAGEVETACKAFDQACRLLVPEPDEFWIAGHPAESEKKDEEKDEKMSEGREDEKLTGEKRKRDDEEEEEAGPSEQKRRALSEDEAEFEDFEAGGLSGRQRSHGWLGAFSLDIPLDAAPGAVREDEDNSALLEALKDQEAVLARSYLPLVRSWLRTFSAEEDQQDRLMRCQDLKAMIQERLRQFSNMRIRADGGDEGEEDESDDSDLEDVQEKEGYEEEPEPEPEPEPGPSRRSPQPQALRSSPHRSPHRSPQRSPQRSPERRSSTEAASQDPTAPTRGEAGPSKRARGGKAPHLRFGLDLLSWGREAEPMVRVREEHFWSSSEPESVIIPVSGAAVVLVF